MRHVGLAAAFVVGVSLSMNVHAAGNPDEGKLKFDTCAGCHSIPGYSNVYPSFRVPRIGGQNEQYIISALKAYKAGQRNHETMTSQAASLSDQDMADIAAFITSVSKQ